MSEGTSVIARTGALLRAIGSAGSGGATTTELARSTGLARPTAHRLLTALAAEGLVDREHGSGTWSLGPELYLLGATAAGRYDVTERARDLVWELARATGESAFLSARRGDETVCLLGEEGSFPLRSHVLHEGIRFPLGVASAGLVILSHLPAREVDDYFARSPVDPKWGGSNSEAAIRERIAATLSTGYAVNPGTIVEGSWGLGAAVFDRAGQPAWALSLTGVQTRFRPDREPALGAALLRAAHEMTQRLRS